MTLLRDLLANLGECFIDAVDRVSRLTGTLGLSSEVSRTGLEDDDDSLYPWV